MGKVGNGDHVKIEVVDAKVIIRAREVTVNFGETDQLGMRKPNICGIQNHNRKLTDAQWFSMAVGGIVGKRVMFKELTGVAECRLGQS